MDIADLKIYIGLETKHFSANEPNYSDAFNKKNKDIDVFAYDKFLYTFHCKLLF